MTSHHPTRRRAVTLLLTAVVAFLAVPAAAHAASSTTCLGSSVITYSPGLTNTAQTVTYTETDTLTPCLSTNPALTNGGFTGSITLPGTTFRD
jgi:hypothetical protein